MPKANVKVMLSYDYCHFEIALGSEEDMSLERIDELRKDAQRLADRAVEQYRVAREKAQLRLQLQDEKKLLKREVQNIRSRPEAEWTAVEKAKVKALEDNEYWSQHAYDYED